MGRPRSKIPSHDWANETRTWRALPREEQRTWKEIKAKKPNDANCAKFLKSGENGRKEKNIELLCQKEKQAKENVEKKLSEQEQKRLLATELTHEKSKYGFNNK